MLNELVIMYDSMCYDKLSKLGKIVFEDKETISGDNSFMILETTTPIEDIMKITGVKDVIEARTNGVIIGGENN